MSHYFDVVPFKEIAQELGISEREAENTYKRAIYKLKKEHACELAKLRTISQDRRELASERIEYL